MTNGRDFGTSRPASAGGAVRPGRAVIVLVREFHVHRGTRLSVAASIVCTYPVVEYNRMTRSAVDDLLFERGINMHETVRFWCNRFGPLLAVEIRKRRVHYHCHSKWGRHLDACTPLACDNGGVRNRNLNSHDGTRSMSSCGDRGRTFAPNCNLESKSHGRCRIQGGSLGGMRWSLSHALA